VVSPEAVFPEKMKRQFFTTPVFGFIAGLHFFMLFVYGLKNFVNNEKIWGEQTG